MCYWLNLLSSQLQFNSNVAQTGFEPAIYRIRGGHYTNTATAGRYELWRKLEAFTSCDRKELKIRWDSNLKAFLQGVGSQ